MFWRSQTNLGIQQQTAASQVHFVNVSLCFPRKFCLSRALSHLFSSSRHALRNRSGRVLATINCCDLSPVPVERTEPEKKYIFKLPPINGDVEVLGRNLLCFRFTYIPPSPCSAFAEGKTSNFCARGATSLKTSARVLRPIFRRRSFAIRST